MPADRSAAQDRRYRSVHVYCGCSLSTGMFDDRECSYETDVLLDADGVEDEFATFNCPECGAEGLLVTQHVV